MKRMMIGLVSVSALALSAHASNTGTKQLALHRALDAPQHGPLYAYDMAVEDEGISAAAHIDPSRPAGQRVNIMTPPKDAWPEGFAQEVANIDADSANMIWCHGLSKMIPRDAKLLEQTDSTAMYSFTPIPVPGDEDDEMVMKHLTGYVTVDVVNPAILSFQMEAKKPFKPIIFAKVKSLDVKVSCERSPDGRTYMTKMDSHVIASIMMKTVEEIETQRITNLRRVSP